VSIENIIKEKCTLKDFQIVSVFKTYEQNDDFLFITPNGYLIGKPNFEEQYEVSSFILLSDVIHIANGNKNIFNGSVFHLAVDQIIALSPIVRDSFLSELKLP